MTSCFAFVPRLHCGNGLYPGWISQNYHNRNEPRTALFQIITLTTQGQQVTDV